ncbi:hypothetical protein D3C72_2471570 [compost metagenome]
MTEISEVFLNWMTDWLMKEGSTRLKACGMMMRHMTCRSDMAMALAASVWPLSMERMPPRKISE